MGDEEEGATFGQHLFDTGIALVLESLISHGENLVHEQDRFFQAGDNRESQAHLHT